MASASDSIHPKAKFKALGGPEYPTAAELAQLEAASEVVSGPGRIVALHLCSSTLCQIHYQIR